MFGVARLVHSPPGFILVFINAVIIVAVTRKGKTVAGLRGISAARIRIWSRIRRRFRIGYGVRFRGRLGRRGRFGRPTCAFRVLFAPGGT